jgi:hypothetical protein
MTTGAVFMFGFGIVWLVTVLPRGNSSPAWFRFALLVAGTILGVSIAMMGVRASAMPHSAVRLTAPQVAANQRIGQHFYVIFGAELVAILLAVIALKAIHYPDYILCGIALIVGVHFFPLAALFRAPLYYGTALVGCAIGLIGFFVTDPALRQKVVGISFGLLLWVTAAVVVGMGLFNAFRAASSLQPT